MIKIVARAANRTFVGPILCESNLIYPFMVGEPILSVIR